jgi:hypothetical protein
LAQEGPVRLFGQPATTGAPAPAPAPLSLAPTAGGGSGIVAQDLGGMNADGYGLLDYRSGDLGRDLWGGTTMDQALALIADLPMGAPSRAMTALARRVLLSTATPPEAQGNAGALMPARADALFRLGLQGDLADLLGRVPDEALSPALRGRRMEARLLLGQFDPACADAKAGAAAGSEPLFQKAQVFCQARTGESDAAALGMDMLREMGQADAAFLVLAERLGGLSKGKVPAPKVLDPLTVTLYREAREPFAGDPLAQAEPWLDRAVALSGPAAPAQRLAGGEIAEATGALPPDALRYMYGDTPLTPAEKARSLESALSENSPTARALAFQLVQALPNTQARGAAMAKVLEQTRATNPGLYLTQVRVYLPMLREVQVRDDALAFGPALARALYGAGDAKAGAAWLRFLQSKERDDANAQAASKTLWSMDRVASHRVITDALPLTDEMTRAFVPGPTIPLESLGMAVARRATAETALLALISLGAEGGPATANWIIVDEVARGLEAVGLADAAATLVLEALAVRMD